MSIVWAKHKAFVLVRPTCHFLIKLFCVGGNEALQATSEQCVRNSWVGEKLLPYRRATICANPTFSKLGFEEYDCPAKDANHTAKGANALFNENQVMPDFP